MTAQQAARPTRSLDPASRRRLAILFRRAEQMLAEAAAASPDGRAQLQLILIQHSETLDRRSRIDPPSEYAPE